MHVVTSYASPRSPASDSSFLPKFSLFFTPSLSSGHSSEKSSSSFLQLLPVWSFPKRLFFLFFLIRGSQARRQLIGSQPVEAALPLLHSSLSLSSWPRPPGPRPRTFPKLFPDPAGSIFRWGSGPTRAVGSATEAGLTAGFQQHSILRRHQRPDSSSVPEAP